MSTPITTPFGPADGPICSSTELLDLTPRQLGVYIENRAADLTFPVSALFNLSPRKDGNDPALTLASGPVGVAYSRPRRVNTYRDLRAWFDGAVWASVGQNWRHYLSITPSMDAYGWDCETPAIGHVATFSTPSAAEAYCAGSDAAKFAFDGYGDRLEDMTAAETKAYARSLARRSMFGVRHG